jgi:hypothetical protein
MEQVDLHALDGAPYIFFPLVAAHPAKSVQNLERSTGCTQARCQKSQSRTAILLAKKGHKVMGDWNEDEEGYTMGEVERVGYYWGVLPWCVPSLGYLDCTAS